MPQVITHRRKRPRARRTARERLDGIATTWRCVGDYDGDFRALGPKCEASLNTRVLAAPRDTNIADVLATHHQAAARQGIALR